MDKVFVVTEGYYSDYHICGVFSTEQKAKEYIESLAKREHNHDDPSIKVYELDELEKFVSMMKNGYKQYTVAMDRNGCVVRIDEQDFIDSVEDVKIFQDRYYIPDANRLLARFTVNARSNEGAIKIANEKRTRLIAMDQWKVT